ncbi:MAG: glycosyltransferase family 9 protein [Pseudomonadales bacterium]
MSSLPLSQPPHSLCILRLSAIGDTTHMVPIVRAIQRHWPLCKITWVIGKAEHQLMRYVDGVEFIIFNKRDGWQAWNHFRQLMKKRQFDVLLHMQAALRASSLALCIPAPIKLGFDKSRAIDYQWLFSNQRIAADANQHVLQGFLGFAKALGVPAGELNWRFAVPEDIRNEAAKKLAGSYSDSKTPEAVKAYAVINACSSARKNNWRNWPASYYPAVIKQLSERGLTTVLTGGPDAIERSFAAEIEAHSEVRLINLVGKTSLPELYSIIEGAKLMIAPDTGPAHMGSLANTPTIGLYASSNPERTGPYRWQNLTVNKYPQALQSHMNKAVSQVPWGQRVRHALVMSEISVVDVVEKIDLILTDH